MRFRKESVRIQTELLFFLSTLKGHLKHKLNNPCYRGRTMINSPSIFVHVILGLGCPRTSQSRLTRPSRPTEASWGSFNHLGGAAKRRWLGHCFMQFAFQLCN
ncbi:hypothetical protein CEXT_337551 [Caerostris extrusa]|uniref:Uncharacterized protein n=1 Tax=Caerostris extrusa TaxID=172846 RepID=A0AAV4QJI3_CAEEX|nr:hypothetical protein CEXT_337551 [Caerostris extrusa]